MKYLKYFLLIIATFGFMFSVFTPLPVKGQELVQDKTQIVKAKVIEVLNQGERDLPGNDNRSTYQNLSVEILEGEQKGKIVTIENDFVILKTGDRFFLYHTIDAIDGRETYSFKEVDRRFVVIFFILLFVAVVLFF